MSLKTLQIRNILFYCFVLVLISFATKTNAQLVTNGGFESSDTGIVDSTAGINDNTSVEGWLLQVADGLTPPPLFEIVSDTVEQGNRALKVIVGGLGSNQWDVQAVADSIPVTPGATYNYSIWAKAQQPGAQVNFTVGNYSFTEYGAVRPANLTTQWTEYTLQFTVNDNQTVIRAPIHFNYSGNVDNAIYIDNLRIIDVNAGKKPVTVEAESGELGSYFSTMQAGDVSYITTTVNYTGLAAPSDTGRIATYQVTFQDSGFYSLFVRLRVGASGFDDDSYFYARGFGEKNDTASADWVFNNGLASAGFSDSSNFVDGAGGLGSGVWKWVNATKYTYSGAAGDTFYVNPDSLTKTFQIATREDGLDIDKIAFGKSNLYFTVYALDHGLPGLTSPSKGGDSAYTGPPLAEGSPKFLGNAADAPDNEYINYWTQLTPENAGKWGSVGTSMDTTLWNWNGLDNAYNYAKDNGLIFKDHCLIWGQQQPSWISDLDSAQQISYIEYWIRMVGQKYPDMDMIDVVNEPLNGHNPPDGGGGRANYIKALGGAGTTGWDWVIKCFEFARQYIPNAKLLINDYGIINSNSATTSYLQIINLLKDRELIDGIGVQGHRFELESANTSIVNSNLTRLAATGLPVYIAEFDLGNLGNSGTPNDDQQLQLYQKLFPVLWQHPGVAGITIWGYIEGQTWQSTSYLVRSNGTARPALWWLAQYIEDNPVGVSETASDLPSNYVLEQNYPNPFNPTTNIRYSIIKTTEVTLKVYDILGREVQTLVNTLQKPGQYIITFNAQDLSSGVYFYRLSAGNFNATKKFMLLK